jgi:hypothetical protein
MLFGSCEMKGSPVCEEKTPELEMGHYGQLNLRQHHNYTSILPCLNNHFRTKSEVEFWHHN